MNEFLTSLVTDLPVFCAATTFAAGLVVAQRWLVADVARRFVRLPRFEQALLVVAVCVTTVCAQKSGVEKVEVEGGSDEVEVRGGGGEWMLTIRSSPRPLASALMNSVGRDVLGTPLSQGSSASPSLNNLRVSPEAAVSTNDIARGYAFVEARTNATVAYAMPTNGTVVGTWGKTGAYQDVVRVGLSTDCTDYHGLEEANATFSAEEGDLRKETRSSSQISENSNASVLRAKKTGTAFAFPMGDVCVTSLWTYTCGKVRPRLRDKAHEIVAAGVPMSCVPGEGCLWTAATTNGSWLITWESFRAGREIFNAENEESQRRGEEVATQISEDSSASPSLLNLRVNKNISAQIEFFANGDFITRSNDVEHVYRRVNPDDWDDDGLANEIDDDPLVAADSPQFGPNQGLSVVEHEANYCWIDLVVSQANAKVTFVGDGASNLADPSFIAKAGETNRVTLLIGKSYVATCAFPFEIVGQSSASIDVRRPDDRRAGVCWPVAVALVDGSGTSFEMTVQPSGLAGTFFWTNSCCGVSEKSDSFSFLCASSSCRCTGCSATGFFRYEGYRIACAGGTCGCLPSGGPPQDPASVSASFSKSAIIFEDEYEASDGVTVARRSTRATLVCSAKGGSSGGVATFEIEGASRLTKISGRTLPFSRTLGVNETFSTQIIYEGRPGSGVQPKVTAKFVSNDSRDSGLASSAELTVAQVEVLVYVKADENSSAYRHKFGICEELFLNFYPSGSGIQWIVSSGSDVDVKGRYKCPTYATTNPVKAVCGDAEFTPSIEVVEPSGIEARNPECETYGVSAGRAGWIGLKQEFYILPLDVSFGGIQMEEVPSSVGQRTGYFAHSSFSSIGCHAETMGAGVWNGVSRENRMGDHDIACLTAELLRVDANGDFTEDTSCGWADGWIMWAVPFGWTSNLSARYHADAEPEKTFDPGANQRFTITPTGSVTVEKFGNAARRDIDGKVFCNGTER